MMTQRTGRPLRRTPSVAGQGDLLSACFICALVAIVTAACSTTPDRAVNPQVKSSRIISLAPSITEIAYAIGCGPTLVADTTFDDYPPPARTLPHVADLAHVDLERTAALRPTVVLALRDQEKEGSDVERSLGIPVTYLPNRGLHDLWTDIAGVGKACGRTTQADALTASMQRRIGRIAARHRSPGDRPRVLFLLGLPGFTVGKGSFIDELITLAGGANVAAHVDLAYPNLSPEAIAALDPDVIVVAREVPFGADVRAQEPWRSLRAVRSGRIVVPPDDDLIERPGPRVVDGLAWLERAIRR